MFTNSYNKCIHNLFHIYIFDNYTYFYFYNFIPLANPSKNDFIIEIGPGKGALTIPLSQKVENILAIEIDPLLTNFLIASG